MMAFEQETSHIVEVRDGVFIGVNAKLDNYQIVEKKEPPSQGSSLM